ncbi:hypothetical protein SAMN05444414_10669 [Roseovarius marisflavi]|uniref:Uncharacterized protein n=2 Tax=Roseovarius marisflavi TaxID=1054996 RepID=A0A1M6YAW7_9RHOB|nr:hypothetical protein SAMN05444414_10669 [Roseovarius marisflavi]
MGLARLTSSLPARWTVWPRDDGAAAYDRHAMTRARTLPCEQAARNIAIYPWFLYFQAQLSATEAILLYAIYDVGTTALEVPSG